jgi:aspartyl-tRNA synthetase
MLRTHKIGEVNENLVGKKVKLSGWVDTIREHGNVIFIDLRDRYGKIQTVISKKGAGEEQFKEAKKLTSESCISIEGEVKTRPKGSENNDLATGKVEMSIEKIEIHNSCGMLPLKMNDLETNEDVRLKYRFLDLRSDRMQRSLILRHKFVKAIRDFFDKEGFLEIETPILAKSTPEGARDYVVPSRVNHGKFYALPQSPQLFKQLLMVSGFDKYFQMARCFRDEDLRADRQPEFTQIDAEMSFATEEDIFDVVERALAYSIKEVFDIQIKIPFPRISYDESMKKYGNDKPDIRKNKQDSKEFAFTWVTEFPMFEYSQEEKRYVAAHHPFCMPSDISKIKSKPEEIKARSYDLSLNGVELLSGSVRIHKPEIQRQVFELLGLSEEEIKEKFGFMLDAFSYGAPPHAGFAVGFDRLIQILNGENSIREVVAFPKNKEARDMMLDAPSDITKQQMKDVSIKLDLPKKKK